MPQQLIYYAVYFTYDHFSRSIGVIAFEISPQQLVSYCAPSRPTCPVPSQSSIHLTAYCAHVSSGCFSTGRTGNQGRFSLFGSSRETAPSRTHFKKESGVSPFGNAISPNIDIFLGARFVTRGWFLSFFFRAGGDVCGGGKDVCGNLGCFADTERAFGPGFGDPVTTMGRFLT